MKTKKKIWYRNRILWRVQKNKLLDKDDVYLLKDFEEDKLALIRGLIGKEVGIIIIMWEASNCWTLLADDSIYSFHSGSLKSCQYDEIKKQLHVKMPEHYENNKDIKMNVEFIHLEVPDIYIWAPRGSALIALMNILLMFPLCNKTNTN